MGATIPLCFRAAGQRETKGRRDGSHVTTQRVDVEGAYWCRAWRRDTKTVIKDVEFMSSVTVSAQGEGIPGGW